MTKDFRHIDDPLLNDISDDALSSELYFPTIVFKISCASSVELNQHLLAHIYAERNKDTEGIVRSNFRGLRGWHSHNKLHRDKVFDPLTKRINQAGARISKQLGYDEEKVLKIGTMWSIINPPGSANKAHVHPGAHWSGVYYVQAPEGSGDIEFIDPRTSHIMTQPTFSQKNRRNRASWTKVQYPPRAGNMLIFPSWLYHSVNPNLSKLGELDSERVIVSFNLSQT